MNSLLQTFFIAILGVLILTSPVEERMSSVKPDFTTEVQSSSFTGVAASRINSEDTEIEDYTHAICATRKSPKAEKAQPDTPSSNSLLTNPYLSKSLDKFFLLVGYLTGFEKLSSFLISQGD